MCTHNMSTHNIWFYKDADKIIWAVIYDNDDEFGFNKVSTHEGHLH